MAGSIIWRSVLFVFIASTLFMAAGCSKKSSGGGGSGDEASILLLAQLINDERDSRGVSRLTWDGEIAAVEQAHAQWLADQVPPGLYQTPYREEGVDEKLFPARLDDAGVEYSNAQEWGVSSTTLTNAGLVFDQLPDWVFEAQWDRFGIGYVKPPKREAGYQYWVLGFVDN